MMGNRARQASAERKLVVDRTDAPGNKRSTDDLRGGRRDKPLRNTNRNLAYFGLVPMNEMVGSFTSFRTVAFRRQAPGYNHAPESDIVDQNTNEPWLKFVLNGKILFVARKNLARNISWTQLYEMDIVGSFGTLGVGGTNQGGARPRTDISGNQLPISSASMELRSSERTARYQTKRFAPSGNDYVNDYVPGATVWRWTIDTGYEQVPVWGAHYTPRDPSSPTYDIRLLTGGSAPIATTNGQQSGLFNFFGGGEWDELLVSVSEHTAWNKRGWASFTNAELGIRTDATNAFRQNGTASWVQNNAGQLAQYGIFSNWFWRHVSEIFYTRMIRGFGGRRTGTAGRDAAIVHPDLSTSNIKGYIGPNGPPGTGGGNVTRQFVAWRPVLELMNPEDTKHPAGYIKLHGSKGFVFSQVVISGGGRGGAWKGSPRVVPNNVSWTAGA
jgi:hypothetical protein